MSLLRDEINFGICHFRSVPPVIDPASTNTEPRVVINQTILLHCPVSGIPTPDVKWLRNDEPVNALR